MFKNIPGSFAEKILCSISEPAVIYDENRDICWVNPAAEIFFGHSSEYLHGMKCSQVFRRGAECMDKCPVDKAFETGSDHLLAVDTLTAPAKMVEAIPCGIDDNSFVLAIIHSTPEVNRYSALRRDLAASLNSCATLEEVSHHILDAVENLVYSNRTGIYILTGDELVLENGRDVPHQIQGIINIGSLQSHYLPMENLPETLSDEFPAGISLLPVSLGKIPSFEIYLLAGRVCWGADSRGMLEMIAGVFSECVRRLPLEACAVR